MTTHTLEVQISAGQYETAYDEEGTIRQLASQISERDDVWQVTVDLGTDIRYRDGEHE